MSMNGGTLPPRPRPRSLMLINRNGVRSLDRRAVLPPLPPPPPAPRPPILETEDSTSLNNILDALDGLERSEESDQEDERDVLTDLPCPIRSGLRGKTSNVGDCRIQSQVGLCINRSHFR